MMKKQYNDIATTTRDNSPSKGTIKFTYSPWSSAFRLGSLAVENVRTYFSPRNTF